MKKGLKTVALFEALKGILSLIVGLGIHKLAGKDLQHALEMLLDHLPLNPASRLPGIILEKTQLLLDANLTLIAIGAVFYAVVRFVEAYGLWNEFVWTEWFALLTGAVYLPFELYEVFAHPGLFSIATLGVNLIVVAYMYWVIRDNKAQHAAETTS